MYSIGGGSNQLNGKVIGATNHIGFNVGNDGNVLPIATGSNPPQEEKQQYRLDILLQAKKNLQSNYKAWEAKLAKGAGKDETNMRNMSRLEQQIQEVDTMIQEEAKS